jgi:branched-chain amino acid transport system substrate-binding protein
MKRLSMSLLAATVAFSMVGCSAGKTGEGTKETSANQAVKEVKVGVMLPLSGSNARIGELQKRGIDLAVENKNNSGGIKSLGGAKIKLIYSDTTGKPEVGVTEAEKLISKEKVDSLLGPYNSAVGSSTAPVAERYKIPYMLVNCTADEILEKGYKYVFRSNQSNSGDASNIADFISGIGKETGKEAKTAAIVFENTDWGKGMANALPPVLEKAGIKVVASESYQANAADMSSIVIKLKNLNPDVIIPMSYLNDAVLLTKTIAEYKLESTIVASAGGFCVPDFVTKAGPAANYVLTLSGWDTDILNSKPKESTELNNQYKSKYNDGDMDSYSVNGWLGASVLMNAIERAASVDKEKVREALASTNLTDKDTELLLHPYKGVKFGQVGKMTNQNIYSAQLMMQVIDGKFKMVGPLGATKNKPVWPAPKWSERK